MQANLASCYGDGTSAFRSDGAPWAPPPEGRSGGGGERGEGCPSGADGGAPRVPLTSSRAGYRSAAPPCIPMPRPPHLGSSSSAMVQSPVLIGDAKAGASPTSGIFSIPSPASYATVPDALSSPTESCHSSSSDDGSVGGFEFKPRNRSCVGAASSVGTLESAGLVKQQSEQTAQIHRQCFSKKIGFSSPVKVESMDLLGNRLSLSVHSHPAARTMSTTPSLDTVVANEVMQQIEGSEEGVDMLKIVVRGGDSVNVAEKTFEDGYNWRKYGQKHVRGSEFPRSYYKCTHPNCQMKKQLERSHDGQITEVIYKGSHDHPKPQPSRRSAFGVAFPGKGEQGADGITTEDICSPRLHLVNKNDCDVELIEASHDGIENAALQLNGTSDDNANNEDPDLKRRRNEATGVEISSIGKINREPRVVVQTVSEIDILDDGYRWRKYGQKVVKGNPNPRSYYKCTNIGCTVRKHVERASHDPKAVITTYEGKHNHDVPASRTSSHDMDLAMATTDISILRSHMAPSFHDTPNIYETRVLQYQSEAKDAISLDLGLSPRYKERVDETLSVHHAGNTQSLHVHTSNAIPDKLMLHRGSVSAFFSSYNTNLDYAQPRGELIENLTFSAVPVNHSSNAYQSTVGSLVKGL